MTSLSARVAPVCLLAAVAAACGGGSGGSGAAQGPSTPALGHARAGESYAVHVPSAVDPSQTIALQVFEPARIVGGQGYPLVLHGHALGASRARTPDALISALIDAGYGVISIDEPGHGESGGDIQLMDPDVEGKELVSVLDWAEAHLDWLAYGPDEDSGTTNLVVGAVGSSYGGAFQMMLDAVDPLKRLDAIVPQVTWNDLDRSLVPAGRPKAIGLTLLSALGHTTKGGFALDDPLVLSFFSGLATGTSAPDLEQLLRYHGERYFCDGSPLSSDGHGRAPLTPPLRPGPVHALFFQGMRDTLFDFNEAYANYLCLRDAGGDVRLLTHQTGHNAVSNAPPDPGAVFQPPGNDRSDSCGGVDPITATLAFFDEHLRGHAGAASAAIPDGVCLSLSAGDSVQVSEVTVGTAGRRLAVPPTAVAPAAGADPAVADLDFTAPDAGDVLAGIPRVEIEVRPALALGGANPGVVLYVGIGQQRAAHPGIWDLVDNQLTPLRGVGSHAIDLSGIGERLAPGDRLALLIYTRPAEFELPAGIAVPASPIDSYVVSGSAFLPLLGPSP